MSVHRYVTRGTFDAYMWQTLQRKAGFIAQLHRSDTALRSIDDVGESALTYAEVKALATGNEFLLEQAQAAADVARLRLLRSLGQQALTAARARLATARMQQHEQHQHERMLGAARARLAEMPPDLDAEAALPDAVRRFRGRWADTRGGSSGRDADGDPAPVRAPWRGLGVELIPAGGWRTPTGDTRLRITLAHRRVDEITLSTATLTRGEAAAVRVVRLAVRRWRADLDDLVVAAGQAAAEAHDTAQDAEDTINRYRFDGHAELAAAEARLAEITAALEASVA